MGQNVRFTPESGHSEALGAYPSPVKDGRNSLWYIEDLNEALDLLKDEGAPSGDPFMEALDGLDQSETH